MISKVSTVITVGSPNGNANYRMRHPGVIDSFYQAGTLQYDKINTCADKFVVFHSSDDQVIDYQAGIEHAQ